MGYLFLTVALFSGLVKGYCSKRIGNLSDNINSALYINSLRMGICAAFGFIIILINKQLAYLAFDMDVFLLYILSAASMCVFVVTWLFAVKNESYMYLSIFTMLGSVVTTILSNILYKETINKSQYIGIIILVFSVILMANYNKELKNKTNFSGLGILILCGLSSGITDFIQKVYMKNYSKSAEVFNFYTYVISFIILGITLILLSVIKQKKGNSDTENKIIDKIVYIFITVMAIALFSNSFFKTLASGILPSVKLYPVLQGAMLILSTVMSVVLFKEKINKTAVIGIILSFVGLVFINI